MTTPETRGSHPDQELLAAIAMDDLEDVGPAQRTHVASCPECRRTVTELRRTAVLLRDHSRPGPTGPVPEVWQRVLEEVTAEGGEGSSRHPAPEGSQRPSTGRRRAPRPRRRARALVAAAVVLALAVGGAVGVVIGRRTGPQPDLPAVSDTLLAKARLSEVGGTAPRGQAELVRRGRTTELRVWATDLGNGAGSHEVWVLNRDGKRMVALGMLGPGESGTFVMPADLVEEGYVDVDVSLEPDDGDPVHSGDSLARGRLDSTT